MSKRPTTIWVPTDRLVPDPANPNKMSKDMREKLARNIERTGHYPPIIVRSLELSDAYSAEHAEDKLMIIDGEHRWRDCVDRGIQEVEVRIWPGISDDRAKHLLLTMNRLQGKDEQSKRASLVRYLAELEGADAIAELLPDDQKAIDAYLAEDTAKAVATANQVAEEIEQIEVVTYFVTPDQRDSIEAAIKHWLAKHDPDDLIEMCRDGAALKGLTKAEKKKRLKALALAEICREYLRREGAAAA